MVITKKAISFLIAISIFVQLITGCADTGASMSAGTLVTETLIEESFINETVYEEQLTQQEFVVEHLYYQNDIYECRVEESVLGEAYIIELVVGENTAEELNKLLPEELESYDVDWDKVLKKFAVGSAIIVATGVINVFLPESTYFAFASSPNVAKEALIGAAFASVFEIGINYVKKGKLPSDAIKKYVIEGAADGFMWGAIYAVVAPFSVPKKLKLIGGEKLKITLDGSVKNAAGEIIGKAYLGRKGIFVLEETAGKTATRVFSKAGKEIVMLLLNNWHVLQEESFLLMQS